MRIKASVGRAPKEVSLNTRCASLELRADTQGEKQFLSSLYRVLRELSFVLTDEYDLVLSQKKRPKKKGTPKDA